MDKDGIHIYVYIYFLYGIYTYILYSIHGILYSSKNEWIPSQAWWYMPVNEAGWYQI
jgi:hypothetical protein